MSKLQCQLIATALEANQTIKKEDSITTSVNFAWHIFEAAGFARAAGELAPLEHEDDLDAHSDVLFDYKYRYFSHRCLLLFTFTKLFTYNNSHAIF